jgi:hypothetical protein
MSGFEETINFNELIKVRNLFIISQTNEEFLKFYINDDFSESERINFIIKKGYLSQKENVIKHSYFI